MAKSKKDDETSVSRRDFFTGGAALGVGAAAAATLGTSSARAESSSEDISWDYQADVIVVGGGAAGLVCAIRARDLGATVLVVEQNFGPGGKMLHSGGLVSLGGGDPVQLRDIAGASDKEGFVTVAPVQKPEELDEDVDFLFRDITDWSVITTSAVAPYKYNERDLHRGWAENCYGTRQLLIDNYVRFARISGTILGGGVSKARQAEAILKLGDKTDIKAGTVSHDDAGVYNVHSSPFAPTVMDDASLTAGPGMVGNGAAIARPLEFSAREKGVLFMNNRHMDEIIREQPLSGRVIGIRASYTPRYDPGTGKRIESYYSNGNLEETRQTITIRANSGIMIATGGHVANPQFRSMFYPAMREPAFVSATWSDLGPRGQDASGILAGLRAGANLAGMQQNETNPITYHVPARLATRDAFNYGEFPGYPSWPFRTSAGFALGTDSFQHLIAVNQVGQRFYNEIDLTRWFGTPSFPGGPDGGTPASGPANKQNDWRNSSPDWVKQIYNRSAGLDAALAMNEGSVAPDYYSGPMWAIFDQGAIDRDGWDVGPPFTSETNGYFFKADTLDELITKIQAGHEFQRVPLKHLKDTVAKWNSYVDGGADPDFARGKDAPMHKIEKAPFFAASIVVVWQDSYGGLRINGKAQVIDMEGQVIPGLFAGGEVSGGGSLHGLGRANVHGFIAGTNIVLGPTGT